MASATRQCDYNHYFSHLTILNCALLFVSVETAKVTRQHELIARYVLITALICCSSVSAIAELKLGQYSHRNTVPVLSASKVHRDQIFAKTNKINKSINYWELSLLQKLCSSYFLFLFYSLDQNLCPSYVFNLNRHGMCM